MSVWRSVPLSALTPSVPVGASPRPCFLIGLEADRPVQAPKIDDFRLGPDPKNKALRKNLSMG